MSFNAKPRKQAVVLNRQPVDPVTVAECYLAIAHEDKYAFREHLEKRLRYFPDALAAEKAAEIMGYSKGMVLSHVKQNYIVAVKISGKTIVPKGALVLATRRLRSKTSRRGI